MGKTKIEWATYSKNLWHGCQKVSDECDNCYAESIAENPHLGGSKELKIWGKDEPRKFLKQQIDDVLAWDRKAKREGVIENVFWQSMGDLMEDRRDLDEPRQLAFSAMDQTKNLHHLMLTKRPQNFEKFLPPDWLKDPRPNIWGGVTVGVNKSMWRAEALTQLPFAVRWLSVEPLLEDLTRLHEVIWIGPEGGWEYAHSVRNQIHWIIPGGESDAGSGKARPMHPLWVKHIRDWCERAGIPMLFKQWGEWLPKDQAQTDAQVSAIEQQLRHPDDGMGTANPCIHKWADGTLSIRIGKDKAGRLLDGKEYLAFPKVAA